MPQARDEAGNIWEVDAQDNPVGLVRAASAAPQPITIGRPDPYKPAAEQRANEGLNLERARLGVSQAAEARQAATLPYDVQRAQAEAVKSQAQADAAIKEQANAPRPETARIQAALQTDNVINLLNTARAQIGEGWATGNVAGTGAFQAIPFIGQNSTNLSGSLEGIQGNVINDTLKQLKAASANGASGYGSLTETEAQRLAAAVASLKQAQDAPTLLNNLATVERHYRNALALLNNEDPRNPDVAAKYGVVEQRRQEVPGARRPDGQVTSEGNMERDPTLGGLNATVERYIKEGRDEGYIRNYLNQVRPGMGDTAQGIGEAIQFNRQYPRDALNIDLETSWKPNSGVGQALGEIGMSPLGAGVIGAADTITLGALDNLSANPELTRAAMAGVAEENPLSYLTGQIGGGALAGLGVEAGLGRLGLSGLGRARAGDALYGAGYGAGSADDAGDSRVTSALIGGTAGLAGGALGRGAARGVGRLASGVQDVGVRALNTAGIRMTPGQVMGGTARAVEDRLSGLPFVGDAIRARRTEGLQDFNRAAMGEAVAPIGGTAPNEIGEAGVQSNQDAISAAYRSALDGQMFQADQPFVSDVAAALARGRNIPQLGDQFQSVAENRLGTVIGPNGELSGNAFQDAIQGLRQARSATANEVMGPEFGQSVGDLEQALYGLVQRQAPGVTDAFDAANRAYRNQSVVDDAVLRALNTGGTFTPAQLGMAARQNTVRFGGKRAAARGDRPFVELQRAAQDTLPSTIPDSGTAGRLALPAIIGALAGGGGAASAEDGSRTSSGLATGSVAALLAAAPYSQAARGGLQRVLLSERPAAIQQAGDILINNNRIAGLLAAPYLVDYVGQ